MDGYAYPPAVHYQREDREASEALRKARFVLVHQDGHKPLLAEAYRGRYKIKSRSNNSYLLEGGNATEDRVAINRLKPFHVREGEEEIDLQRLLRRGRPVSRVAGPASPRSLTPWIVQWMGAFLTNQRAPHARTPAN